ncbi:AraC family transcriptional regulator [Aureibaculum conchae]|uniref:AraC family transcriptional regulator n=1 Tax=Aureibaculum sp. 2308TA14-22 TaxID=3108392 RepID=UPI003391CF2F
MMTAGNILSIDDISQLNSILNQGKPKHPLISVVDFSKVDFHQPDIPEKIKCKTAFYCILSKTLKADSLQYGRQHYDFHEGSLFFIAPNQITSLEKADYALGWGLYFHPDLIKGTSLDQRIKNYTYFKYDLNEALHISEEEKTTLTRVVHEIESEINRPVDKHSKPVIVSGIELMLNHCMRFYDRQFITRSAASKDAIAAVEDFLLSYIDSDQCRENGLPTVVQCAEVANLSKNYLSDLLKKETGKSTQDHIHYFLIEQAKSKLLGCNHSVSEIAYELGFEYPQYFSKLFKRKVGMSPLEYRDLN